MLKQHPLKRPTCTVSLRIKNTNSNNTGKFCLVLSHFCIMLVNKYFSLPGKVIMMYETIKKDFPIFKHHKDLVYLDSAATYQKPSVVIGGIQEYYSQYCANVHRAFYPTGEIATEKYEEAREKIAQFINASPEEIVFTRGATEGINFIAHTWGLDHLKRGDDIVITQAEHHANLLPWQRVAKRTGANLRYMPLNTQTHLLENPTDHISQITKLVSIIHSSNVLGHIWQADDLEQTIAKAHSVGAKVLLDSCQTSPHQKIDVKKLNVDFLVFSGHKTMGPNGVGVLYIKKELHDDVEPYQLGGSMVHSVAYDTASWAQAPQKFEAGTPAVASVIGLGHAIDYISKNINFASLAEHETKLSMKLYQELQSMPEVSLLGNPEMMKEHSHLVCFSIDGVHAHDAASYLGAKNIAVRAGHHCAQPLANLLGVQSCLRASIGIYNNEDDVTHFINELRDTITFFKR